MTLTIFDELIAKGKAEAILQILTMRFQSLPVRLEKKLSNISDIEQLAVLIERALYCESLKAFADSIH